MESILFIIAYVIVGLIGLDMAGRIAARNIAELLVKRSTIPDEIGKKEIKRISNEVLDNAPTMSNVWGSRSLAIAITFIGVMLWPVFIPASLYNWNHNTEEVARFMGIDI